MQKKKIVFHSDFSKMKTGFARNAREVLLKLHSTGKYDLVEYSCAPLKENDPYLKSVPWKAYGAIPENAFIRDIMARNPDLANNFKYGSYFIDEIIDKEKPDCYIGVNDFWGFNGYYDKPWWNKINSALWITVDSLPLLPDSISNAHKIKNFWVWSKFAENEFHRLGHDHVKTLHAAFDVSTFKPLDNRAELREAHGIEPGDFIVGFVFRNQLRKLVGTLIEAFSIAKKECPQMKLLLHTSWVEGWDIEKLAGEYGVDLEYILTTHICPNCKKYEIKPFAGDRVKCGHCGCPEQQTPKTYLGVTEEDMNEIYNMMDYYVQPVTSGGLEMPLVEAMMAGIPCATCNYSCGEEYCETGLVQPIPFNLYREFRTEFLKSQPDPLAFAKILTKAASADLSGVAAKGREWARENYDVDKTCQFIQDWVDNSPEVDHDSYTIGAQEVDETYYPPDIEDDVEWCKNLVSGISNTDESEESESIKALMKKLREGESRESLLKKAQDSAKKFNKNYNSMKIEEWVDIEAENVVLISPNEIWDKILLIDKIKDLTKEGEKLAVVGTEYDVEILSQGGSFSLIPVNEHSIRPEKLLSMKSKKQGKPAFKRVYLFHGNEFNCIVNTSD